MFSNAATGHSDSLLFNMIEIISPLTTLARLYHIFFYFSNAIVKCQCKFSELSLVVGLREVLVYFCAWNKLHHTPFSLHDGRSHQSLVLFAAHLVLGCLPIGCQGTGPALACSLPGTAGAAAEESCPEAGCSLPHLLLGTRCLCTPPDCTMRNGRKNDRKFAVTNTSSKFGDIKFMAKTLSC